MIKINEFISLFEQLFPALKNLQPWEIASELKQFLVEYSPNVEGEYKLEGNNILHKTAVIEPGSVIKGPVFISEGCFIGAGAYLREGVFLGKNVSIGPGCEIKSSLLFDDTKIAHFNFIGNSIIGVDVNFEAGAVIANHYNERQDKDIYVLYNSEIINTQVQKFGALVGDHSRIGANSVLSPGTILSKNSVVKRLELVNQLK